MSGTKPKPGYFRVLYFAAAATFTGRDWDDIKIPVRLHDLPGVLEKAHPGFREAILTSCAITLNLEYVDLSDFNTDEARENPSDTIIQSGDEIAVIPPVSSG